MRRKESGAVDVGQPNFVYGVATSALHAAFTRHSSAALPGGEALAVLARRDADVFLEQAAERAFILVADARLAAGDILENAWDRVSPPSARPVRCAVDSASILGVETDGLLRQRQFLRKLPVRRCRTGNA